MKNNNNFPFLNTTRALKLLCIGGISYVVPNFLKIRKKIVVPKLQFLFSCSVPKLLSTSICKIQASFFNFFSLPFSFYLLSSQFSFHLFNSVRLSTEKVTVALRHGAVSASAGEDGGGFLHGRRLRRGGEDMRCSRRAREVVAPESSGDDQTRVHQEALQRDCGLFPPGFQGRRRDCVLEGASSQCYQVFPHAGTIFCGFLEEKWGSMLWFRCFDRRGLKMPR